MRKVGVLCKRAKTYCYFKNYILVMLKRNHIQKIELPGYSRALHLLHYCKPSLESACWSGTVPRWKAGGGQWLCQPCSRSTLLSGSRHQCRAGPQLKPVGYFSVISSTVPLSAVGLQIHAKLYRLPFCHSKCKFNGLVSCYSTF